MKRTITAITLAATAIFATVAIAAEPQELRQEAMKQVGGATGVLSKMAKGETPFDAAAAVAAFTTMNTVAKTYADLFPVGSETGFETEAKPEIWANMDDFKAKVAKFEADTAAAAAMTFADAGAVGAAFGTVAANCKACHEVYRVAK
ncbi:MAG: cytochrome c [Rhizobiaceae bacterium]|jgi:cytochrome c556|nr:cytochrome c [Rhizobiaceae bacterium]